MKYDCQILNHFGSFAVVYPVLLPDPTPIVPVPSLRALRNSSYEPRHHSLRLVCGCPPFAHTVLHSNIFEAGTGIGLFYSCNFTDVTKSEYNRLLFNFPSIPAVGKAVMNVG